ncbi:MAG TPA: hypothetical protein VMT71_17840 [Syntrophorhabdales bacterium]|nr:hypothetical protein [Syntrophorhabdales bacterium]
MATAKMVCPFSGKMCVQCGIFRGRHAGFCYVSSYRGFVQEGQVLKRPESMRASETKFDFPDLPFDPNRLANLEDCTERRDT